MESTQFENFDSFEKRVSALWEEYAKVYPFLIHSSAYKGLVHDFLEGSNVENLRTGGEVLDLGAGTGNITNALLEKNPAIKITAVDNNDAMVQYLNNRFSEDSRVSVKKEDIGDLDVWKKREEVFNIVASNLVLPYITHLNGNKGKDVLPELIKYVYGSLSEDGTFVWSSPKNEVNFGKVFKDAVTHLDFARVPGHSPIKGLKSAKRILSHANEIAELGRLGIFYFPKEEDIIDIMKESGFRKITIKESFVKQSNVITGKKI